jgi:hypothetical protein
MVCPKCRANNATGVAFCASCGQQLPVTGGGERKGLAITAVVLGILSYPLVCAFGAGILTALIGLACGIVGLVKVNRDPQEFGGKGLAIAGIVTSGAVVLLIPVWLIVAAIAIPSLFRARIAANEAGALGDVRTIVSAEVAYAASNAGYYDSLECLAQPQGCLPGNAASTPFIDVSLASGLTKNGYDRKLFLGPAAPRGGLVPTSPSSAVAFAYVAVPAQQGRTGMRAFCADATGVVRFNPAGTMPSISDGTCPDSWSVVGY